MSTIRTGHPPIIRYCIAAAVGVLVLLGTLPVSAGPPAPWVGKQLDGKPCKGRTPDGGKSFDYLQRHLNMGSLTVVEEHHMTDDLLALRQGVSTSVSGDIDFILRIWPNHPSVLEAMTRYCLRHKKHPKNDKALPVECYLQRAMEFSPRDPLPPRLLGHYMYQRGRVKLALEANLRALQLTPGDAMLQYNTALMLVKVQRHEEAYQMARPLYDAGLTVPGLRQKLIRAGAWEFTEEEKEQVRAYRKQQRDQKLIAQGLDPNDPGGQPETSAGGLTEEELRAAVRSSKAQNSSMKKTSNMADGKKTANNRQSEYTEEEKAQLRAYLLARQAESKASEKTGAADPNSPAPDSP